MEIKIPKKVKVGKFYENDIGQIVVFKGITLNGEYRYVKFYDTNNLTRPKKDRYIATFKDMEQFIRVVKIREKKKH